MVTNGSLLMRARYSAGQSAVASLSTIPRMESAIVKYHTDGHPTYPGSRPHTVSFAWRVLPCLKIRPRHGKVGECKLRIALTVNPVPTPLVLRMVACMNCA
jgi:hypothetical protein